MKKKNETDVQLPTPIVAYYNRLKAFLECDKEIKTELDYDTSTIYITISNSPKAAAWREILPETIEIGTKEVTINIECDKHGVDGNVLTIAMDGNSAFSRYYHLYIPEQMIDRNFCYFKPQVIQFKNDNFGSPESVESRLAEDLARELLDIPTLNYCTEIIR